MKSERGESPKLLQTGPESAEIYDFLYADRARISALYAQLFPQGILTSVKTTAQQSFSDDSNVGTDVKILKAEAKSTESGSEGVEHLFDASWSIPLEVLARLESLSLVRQSLKGAGLGSVILTNCHMRLVDFASMNNLWGPSLRMFAAAGQQGTEKGPQIIPEVIPTITDALKSVPQAIHAHFLTPDAFLWSSLQPGSLTIPISDLTLKYGGSISGEWKLLYLLDAWADSGQPPDFSGWSGGDVINSVLTAMHGLRVMMGRPSGWFGITPLMIFRNAKGWLPSAPSA